MSPEEFARLAIEVPFVEKGRSTLGWDCWGMVHLFHRHVLGVEIPSYLTDYINAGSSIKGRRQLATLIGKHLSGWDRVEHPAVGDVVLLNINGRPIHVGIAIDADRMLHTEAKCNTLIERLASPMWSRRIEGFYRAR